VSTATTILPSSSKELSRRDFLIRLSGGLAIGFVLPSLSRSGSALAASAPGAAINTWLQIGTDESITLTIGSSEMGQGSFSGLAQILAEDLMVDYTRVVTSQGGPTLSSPAPIGSSINTVGSSVTRSNYWKLRDAAATAREMLVQAAMNTIADPNRANYTVSNGVVTHNPSLSQLTYGQLATAAAALPAPTGAPLVADSDFKILGKTLPRFDIPAKVDGSAKYGIDIRLPNMLYGVMKHSPSLGGTLASTFAVPTTVAGRFIFYNNSLFDGNDPGPSPADDNAIAPDKTALLPGQTATFANFTTYVQGINGLMIDFANLPAGSTITAADFAFLRGATGDPSTWADVPVPISVTPRLGAGVNKTDRITIIFPDRSIVNQWLRVTVLASANTGLTSPDVFYFGNLVGDANGNGSVTISDIALTKSRNGQTADLFNPVDFNRSGSVTISDVAIAKSNNGHSLQALIAPDAPLPPPATLAVIPTRVVATTNRGLEATNNINAVVVVSTNTWDAWQAAKGLRVTWNLPANAANLNTAQFLADAQQLAVSATPFVSGGANPPGTLYTVEGNATTALSAINSGSGKVLDATYTLPYVSHACFEVLNCTVDYIAGVKCDVYAPTQSAKAALGIVTSITGLPASKVHINTTFLGGGLGRKAEVDFISQAVQAAMVLNRPIKVMWPREEDFTHDQYRPMALIHVVASVDAAGNIAGWAYRNISPSIIAQRGAVLGKTGDSQGYEASQNLPYAFGARVTEYVTHPSPIPVGFWRSVGASLNTFAVESMIDELATAAGVDPYLFRRNLLAANPRWLAVLDAAATLGDWNSPPPAGHFRGIAIGTAFNSIVAQVVEISAVTATGLRVNRASIAIDCYLAVNPGQIETQLIGGMVHGMNAALYGKQTFVNGAAQSKNFNQSRMIRMGEMPQVAVTLIPSPAIADRAQNIGGVGELGVPTFAPALANAYFKATGTRARALPLFPNAVMGGL
jgi:CO/xanthine dehydrogenase Mo-binding subunit